MPFHHKYKCRKCGYFVIETETAAAPLASQHVFLANKYKKVSEHGPIWGAMAIGVGRRAEDCLLYVSYVETTQWGGAAVDLLAQARNKALARGSVFRDKKHRRAKEGAPSMVAVMYDPVTECWFDGQTGMDGVQGHIPAAVWGLIPDRIEPEKYAFGRTCAEVHCLRKAYGTRSLVNRVRLLEEAVFAAYSPLDGTIRPPCGACAGWIRSAGGRAVTS